MKYEQSRKMPYLALIDQLSRFIRQKSAFLIIAGYSFSDAHLNDTILNSLKANPTAMVLALMYDTYTITNKKNESVERYPRAYKLAENQHNLNIWTLDQAIIGTNIAEWGRSKETEEKEILNFIESKKNDETSEEMETQIKMGNFNIFADFLKILIGVEKEQDNVK